MKETKITENKNVLFPIFIFLPIKMGKGTLTKIYNSKPIS